MVIYTSICLDLVTMASMSAAFPKTGLDDDGYAVIVFLQVSKTGLVTMVKMSLVSLQDTTGDDGEDVTCRSPRLDWVTMVTFLQDWTGDDGRTVTWFSPSLQDRTGDDGEDVTCLSPGLDWVTMVTFLQDWTR